MHLAFCCCCCYLFIYIFLQIQFQFSVCAEDGVIAFREVHIYTHLAPSLCNLPKVTFQIIPVQVRLSTSFSATEDRTSSTVYSFLQADLQTYILMQDVHAHLTVSINLIKSVLSAELQQKLFRKRRKMMREPSVSPIEVDEGQWVDTVDGASEPPCAAP